MTTITDKTRITMTVVVSLLGFCSWLTMIYTQGVSNAQAISEIQVKQTKIDAMATDIAVMRSELHEMKSRFDELER